MDTTRDRNTSRLKALHPPNASRRISMLLWGEPGTGKTTLAATAPGRKLIYLFDPDGAASLVGIDEPVLVRNVFEESDNVVLDFKKEDPLNIREYLADFDTFVFDSLTNITAKTLDYGTAKAGRTPAEMPQKGAYGSRNVLALALVKNVLAITSKAEKHVIFTAHQSTTDVTEGDGLSRHTAIALGGKLPSQIAPSFSEIWNLRMADSVKKRRLVMTRSKDKYTPIKTRMWTEQYAEFTWDFNAEDWSAKENERYRLDTWYKVWNHHNKKMPHPDDTDFTTLIEGMK